MITIIIIVYEQASFYIFAIYQPSYVSLEYDFRSILHSYILNLACVLFGYEWTDFCFV